MPRPKRAKSSQSIVDILEEEEEGDLIDPKTSKEGDLEYYESQGWDFFRRLVNEKWTEEEEFAYRAIVCMHNGEIDELKVKSAFLVEHLQNQEENRSKNPPGSGNRFLP